MRVATRTLTRTLTSVTSKSPTDDGLVECSGKLHMVDLAGLGLGLGLELTLALTLTLTLTL